MPEGLAWPSIDDCTLMPVDLPFPYDYVAATSRNIGWLTGDEQAQVRQARVAIAGLGGVGGAHLLTLARLGVAKFHIADFDQFEVHNLNRQAGAFMSTLGARKVDAVAAMARDVNPESEVRTFADGVTAANLDLSLIHI